MADSSPPAEAAHHPAEDSAGLPSAESLLDSVQNTGHELRTLAVSFIGVLLYVNIIVASTTHEQLLRVSPVTLPLLNIDIPIVGFYQLVPLLILLLHVHVLLQHLFYSQQLALFERALEQTSPQMRDYALRNIGSYPFAHWLVGRQHTKTTHSLLSVVVAFSMLLWPLIALVAMQMKFLAYHDEGVTSWHRIVVLLDCIAIAWLWPKIVDSKDRAGYWWKSGFLNFWPALIRLSPARLRRDAVHGMDGASPLSVIALLVILVVFAFFSGVVSTVPGTSAGNYESKVLAWLPDFLLSDVSEESRRVFVLTAVMHEGADSPIPRNLTIRSRVITANELPPEVKSELNRSAPPASLKVMNSVEGIDLTGRHLEYANFSSSSFPRAILNKANLTGANLNWTALRGSSLVGTQLKNARMVGVKLAGSDVSGADFSFADMENASLFSATITGASFRGARMQGADFWFADGKGKAGDFSFANMMNVSVAGAVLAGSTFESADMRDLMAYGTDFGAADFKNAVTTGLETALPSDVGCSDRMAAQREVLRHRPEFSGSSGSTRLEQLLKQSCEQFLGATNVSFASPAGCVLDRTVAGNASVWSRVCANSKASDIETRAIVAQTVNTWVSQACDPAYTNTLLERRLFTSKTNSAEIDPIPGFTEALRARAKDPGTCTAADLIAQRLNGIYR